MDSVGWIRSRQVKGLLWSALALSLVLGAAFVIVEHFEAEPAHRYAAPLTDDQAEEQVVGSARRIVAAAQLRDATAAYTFVSCGSDDGPPYQAALYMNFVLPQGDWGRHLDQVAAAMIADGWADAPATAQHFGRKLTGDGVTAVLQRNVDDIGFATLRLYGECRNIADHRNDNPAWREVSL